MMGISTATIPSMIRRVPSLEVPSHRVRLLDGSRDEGNTKGNRAMAMVSIMVAQAPPLAMIARRGRPRALARLLTMGSSRPRAGTHQSQGCAAKLLNQPSGASATCFISGVRAPLRSPISCTR
ncbi:hypothetical protein D3C79_857720 [compost metagenome]